MAASKKKKSSAKRATKTVAKAATQPSVKAAQTAQTAWKQQSAKLYQLPFAQGNVSDAAASMQSATEDFMRMGNDAMQQWFNATKQSASNPEAVAAEAKAKVSELFKNVPGFDALGELPNFNSLPKFDAAEAQEKLSSFARESAAQLSKSAQGAKLALEEAVALSRENGEAVVEVTNIAVAVSKEVGAELISYANRSFSQNVELGKQLLTCRTLNDIFDLGGRIVKNNLDGFFSESVKLSELLFQASTNVSEPINERITESSERLSKAMAA